MDFGRCWGLVAILVAGAESAVAVFFLPVHIDEEVFPGSEVEAGAACGPLVEPNEGPMPRMQQGLGAKCLPPE